ncbi:MAG: hypothetical protein LBG04_03825 [Holosporaceae bacterium]|jgi:hypothetical protein|nr:hypothetical protein [Holosporaceae bacterium]
MKKIFLLCVICSFAISCGRRGALEPYEKEDIPYPRQYPHAEIQEHVAPKQKPNE